MKIVRIAAMIVLCAALLPGCAKPEDSTSDADKASAAAGAKPSTPDSKIAEDVKGKFAAHPELKNEKIDVTVKDGRVTLLGDVSNDSIRVKAEDAARDVNDVFGVDAEKLVVKQ